MNGIFCANEDVFDNIIFTSESSKGFCDFMSMVETAGTDMGSNRREGNNGNFAVDGREGFI